MEGGGGKEVKRLGNGYLMGENNKKTEIFLDETI